MVFSKQAKLLKDHKAIEEKGPKLPSLLLHLLGDATAKCVKLTFSDLS
jgi:hypothetical protein